VLRVKHVVLIAVAAVFGVVSGYVLMSGRIHSTGQGPASSVGTPADSPTVLPANAGTPRTGVPDLRGHRLPDALAQLKAAGYRTVHAVDATSQNRVILEETNWVVDSQDPAPGTAASADSSIVLRVKKNTDDSTPGPATLGVVPNVVCAELQAAQDALRASGFLLITSTDGTGQGRLAVLDRNWVVIGQSAAPGTKPGLTTHIELTIVKYGEPTGSSGCKS
jgi:beta-lactam-binding protein with PASTA domain